MSKVRILVIDDDADLRSMLQMYLESEGYEVAVASDGREGMRVQKQAPADIVVTDVFMPGKEGIETIRDLQRDFPGVKIIVMSGGANLARMDYLNVAVLMGAVRSLRKPFEPAELSQLLRELETSPAG